MPKPAVKTTLYRLIEAGHLARQHLLTPLLQQGLEAGDDAILFGLLAPEGETLAHLIALTGLTESALNQRLNRLLAAGIVTNVALGAALEPGVRLSDKGRSVTAELDAHWQQLNDALIGELDHSQRKGLRRVLKRFVSLLDI